MTAREMFEKLEFTRKLDSKELIYTKALKGTYHCFEITFDLTEKEVELYDDHEDYTINRDLLKAIDKQAEELGVDLMTKKEEYEKAIENIREAFYATTCPEWALEKFATNLDFISISIKEHFEEKDKHFEENIETNFEHYRYEILEYFQDGLAVVKGIPKLCYKTNCNDCDFKINQIGCRQKVKDWLKQPYKKLTYKLNKFEFDLIQTYSDCHESCKFSEFKQLIELKNKGYFKNVDKNELIKDILANCEVVG